MVIFYQCGNNADSKIILIAAYEFITNSDVFKESLHNQIDIAMYVASI